MKQKRLLLKISFTLLLLLAGLHTFFILIGGPAFPNTPEFAQMRALMKNIKFDTGVHIQRSMQDIMDGFNIIVAIFLISLPALSWIMLGEIKENRKNITKLTLVNLFATLAFFFTSFAFLAIGGTIGAALVCSLLIISFFIGSKQSQSV